MKLSIQKIITKIKTHKPQALVGLAVVVVLIGAGSFLLFNKEQDSTTQAPIDSKPKFTNYLKPASEIKVGDYRYVSPCQVLRIDDVSPIFGSLGDKGYVRESYYDATVAPLDNLDREIETSCRYRYGNDTEVSLEAKQSFKSVETDNLRFVLYALGTDKMDEKIRMYEKATSGGGEDLKTFVATLKRSAEVYNRQKASRSSDPVDVSGLVFPVGQGLFSFNVVQDNVVYKLDYKMKRLSSEEFKLSDQEIADALSKSARTMDVVKRRITNAKLDQSPAPTILGDTEMVGSTKVLEPCAILTPQLYQAVVGSPANKEIGRVLAGQDLAKDRRALNGSVAYPSNECERDGKANDTSTSVTLEMNYARSSDELQARLEKGYKIDGNDKLLQTKADWAGYFNYGSSGGGYVVFRVGTYYGVINILRTSSGGLFSDIKQSHGGEQEYVPLVNAAVDSIKQYTK